MFYGIITFIAGETQVQFKKKDLDDIEAYSNHIEVMLNEERNSVPTRTYFPYDIVVCHNVIDAYYHVVIIYWRSFIEPY